MFKKKTEKLTQQETKIIQETELKKEKNLCQYSNEVKKISSIEGKKFKSKQLQEKKRAIREQVFSWK